MSDVFVQTEQLVKRFGNTAALNGVDVTIGKGTIIGLIGSNGSGKSTLLRHMVGLYLPSAGRCWTFGVEAGKLGPVEMGRLGYVHQEGQLLDWMTVRQQIDYVAAYYPAWDRGLEERYVEQFGIERTSRVGKLSPGQRQQLAVLLAIGHGPELLLLDEPASALDPLARRRFLDLLLELIEQEGRTIVISSHILADVEKVIDHVIIMDEGTIRRDCSFDELREDYCRVTLTGGEAGAEVELRGVVRREDGDGKLRLILKGVDEEAVKAEAARLGSHYTYGRLTLDELYELTVTGERDVRAETA